MKYGILSVTFDSDRNIFIRHFVRVDGNPVLFDNQDMADSHAKAMRDFVRENNIKSVDYRAREYRK
jgi:hypothetical protein